MLICGYQSILELTTDEIVPAEDGPSVPVAFTVRVETYGFTALRQVNIEQRDVRMFVSQLRAIEPARLPEATLTAVREAEFDLRMGFLPGSEVGVIGHLAAIDRGFDVPRLGFRFAFDPATFPAMLAEAERWMAPVAVEPAWPEREEPEITFERQFLAWLHIRLGVLPTPRQGTNAQWWTFEFDRGAVSFVIIGRTKNSSIPPAAGVDWLLRVEEAEPHAFIGLVERHFEPGSWLRRRMSNGRIRVQFKSIALREPFDDQTDVT
jgi:hypothetical protein